MGIFVLAPRTGGQFVAPFPFDGKIARDHRLAVVREPAGGPGEVLDDALANAFFVPELEDHREGDLPSADGIGDLVDIGGDSRKTPSGMECPQTACSIGVDETFVARF